MTPDPLSAFIEARLAEDEAAALAAARSFGQDWRAELTGGDVVTGRVYGKSRDRYVADAMRGSGSVHIASHDPARAVREVAFGRALLGDWQASVRSVGPGLSVAKRRLVLAYAAIWEGHRDYQAAVTCDHDFYDYDRSTRRCITCGTESDKARSMS